MIRPPTSSERRWLDYLRDLGFTELYDRAAPPPARSVERATPLAADAPTRSDIEEEPSATAAGRAEELGELSRRAAACTACRLAEGRRSVVFGTGNADASLMFIGEGPGAEEDRQGLPFVGPAGRKLTQIIEAIELTREQVYIANIVKCRPPRNRDPRPDEVEACRGYLERQIDLVQPRVIVALGRVAAQTLLGMDAPLGRMRGEWHSVRGVPTRVTYHPAALLRNSSFRRPTWDDMQIVRDRLAETASGPR